MRYLMRSLALVAAVAAMPYPAAAQNAPAPALSRATLGQDFDALPAEARERVRNAFRVGTPQLDDAAIRQRWDAMTAAQRAEAVQTRDRDRDRTRDRDRDVTRDQSRDRDRDRDRDRSAAPQPGGGTAGAGGGSAGGGGGSGGSGGSGSGSGR